MKTLIIAMVNARGQGSGPYLRALPAPDAKGWEVRMTFAVADARKFSTTADAALFARSIGWPLPDADGFAGPYAILHLLPWAIAEAEERARVEWEGRRAS